MEGIILGSLSQDLEQVEMHLLYFEVFKGSMAMPRDLLYAVFSEVRKLMVCCFLWCDFR